ncbi:hypothetical protein AOR13_3545 [Alteromonas stellipolaris LMG 21856]|nr:hypothetical protein AOR13_3545 [Alteromonas stellipolaris LMG 21856]
MLIDWRFYLHCLSIYLNKKTRQKAGFYEQLLDYLRNF